MSTATTVGPGTRSEAPSADPHARRVRDQFVALHPIFDRSRPSAPFRELFDRCVLTELRRRLDGGGASVRLLEVGCGAGHWAETIYESVEGAAERVEYLGIDFAQPAVEACNRRLAARPRGRAIVGDFERLAARPEFDVVLVVEVFCHLRGGQDDRWIERAREWLAPGGAMIVIDKERHSRHGWRVRWDLLKRRVLPARWQGRPYYFPHTYDTLLTTLRYPSFSHLARSMTRAGFRPRPLIRHDLFTAIVGDIA